MDKQFLISTIPRVYYDHVILAHLPEVSRFDIVHIGYLIHGHIFKYSYLSLKYEPLSVNLNKYIFLKQAHVIYFNAVKMNNIIMYIILYCIILQYDFPYFDGKIWLKFKL